MLLFCKQVDERASDLAWTASEESHRIVVHAAVLLQNVFH